MQCAEQKIVRSKTQLFSAGFWSFLLAYEVPSVQILMWYFMNKSVWHLFDFLIKDAWDVKNCKIENTLKHLEFYCGHFIFYDTFSPEAYK